MRHARAEALDELEPFLEQLRTRAGLREKSRGVFYRGHDPFLHFHEDPTGMHADLKIDGSFERFRAQTARERGALLKRVDRALSA